MAAVGHLLSRDAARRVVCHVLRQPDRLAGMGLDREDRLGEVVADGRLDLVAARRLELVAVGAGHRHPAVRAAVPERDLTTGRIVRIVVPLQLRLEDAAVELAGLAWVDALAEGVGRHVVLVLAVLSVQQLRRDDDRGVAVEQGHVEAHHCEMPVLEADHPFGTDLDTFAGGRAPHQLAIRDTRSEVHDAFVLVEVGVAEQQRFVVDVQLEQLGVGHVDDRLAGLGECERVLGVLDRPDLVKAVQKGAVRVGVATLAGICPHADVSVGVGEQRFAEPEVLRARFGLDEAPRIDREPMPRDCGLSWAHLHVGSLSIVSAGDASGLM